MLTNKKIIPSLLAFQRNNWNKELPVLIEHGFNDYWHLDVMEKLYVNNVAYDYKDALMLRSYHVKLRVHLMVCDPKSVSSSYYLNNVDSITFQYQHLRNSDVFSALKMIKQNNIKAGIAINPEDHHCQYDLFLSECDTITIMGVPPGQGGQHLRISALDNLRYVINKRHQDPKKYNYRIEFDGGIEESTLEAIPDEVDFIVSGSWLHHKLFDNCIKNNKNDSEVNK